MGKKGDAELTLRIKTAGEKAIASLRAQFEALKKTLQSGKNAEAVNSLKSAIQGGMDDVISAVKRASIAIGAFGASIAALAIKAGNFQQIERAFRSMATSQGQDADKLLKSMKTLTDGMVSNMDLMTNANKAMMLGLPIERFGELMAVAKSAAESMGQSMEFMLESIVLGIGRQSRLILDNLGIVVDAEKAYENYARTVGKSVNQLTDAQKKQAYLNEVLRIGKENAEAAGGGADNAAKMWQRLKASTENLAVAVGKDLMPVFREAATEMTRLVKAINDLSSKGTISSWSAKFSKDIASASASLRLLSNGLVALFDARIKAYTLDFKGAKDALVKFYDESIQIGREYGKRSKTIEDEAARARVQAALDNHKLVGKEDMELYRRLVKEKAKADKKKIEDIAKAEKIQREKERLEAKRLAEEKAKIDMKAADDVRRKNAVADAESKLSNAKNSMGAASSIEGVRSAAEEAKKQVDSLHQRRLEQIRSEEKGEQEKAALIEGLNQEIAVEREAVNIAAAERELEIREKLEEKAEEDAKERAEKISAFASEVVGGGVQGAVSAGIALGAEMAMPGLGAAAGQLFDLLSKDSHEFMKELDQLFSTDFIDNVMRNIPILLDELGKRAPEIVEHLIEAIIENAPKISNAIAAAFRDPKLWVEIGDAVADGVVNGVRDGLKGATIGEIGSFWGFMSDKTEAELDALNAKIEAKMIERNQILEEANKEAEEEYRERHLRELEDAHNEALSKRNRLQSEYDNKLLEYRKMFEQDMLSETEKRLEAETKAVEDAVNKRLELEGKLEDLLEKKEQGEIDAEIERVAGREKNILDGATQRRKRLDDEIKDLEQKLFFGDFDPTESAADVEASLAEKKKIRDQMREIELAAENDFKAATAEIREKFDIEEGLSLDEQIAITKAKLQVARAEEGVARAAEMVKIKEELLTAAQEELAIKQTVRDEAIRIRTEQIDAEIAQLRRLKEEVKKKDKEEGISGTGLSTGNDTVDTIIENTPAGRAAEVVTSVFGANKGGFVPAVQHFAAGGSVEDTVPAMLTPGEFVVNAGATARNKRTLEAINAGRTPGGGVVINLTVNGGMLGTAQEARQFARAIDKELMRMRRDKESLAFDTSL